MLGMANAVVTIIDSNAVGTIKTITVDGYGASSRTGDSGGIDDTTATMALNFERVGFSGYYDGDAVPNTMNVNPNW